MFLLKLYRYFLVKLNIYYGKIACTIFFSVNRIKYGSFTSYGNPIIEVRDNGKCLLGDNFSMVNNARMSTLGKNNKCKILVYSDAILTIGKKVGISNTVIVVTKSITIGNNILMGGGVTIVDTDFHSLDPAHWHSSEDQKNMISSPVIIHDNVFIGMNTIILKGVTIGFNVIIAAGSVVTRSIPDNQIWGGNPAKFIRNNQTP